MLFRIEAAIASTVGFASHQNAVPLLRELKIVGQGDGQAEDLRLALRADPPFVAEKTWKLDRLAAGDELTINDRDVALNATMLAGLTESMRGSITLTLSDRHGAEFAALVRPVELLAHSE